jgi:hypothetical protein
MPSTHGFHAIHGILAIHGMHVTHTIHALSGSASLDLARVWAILKTITNKKGHPGPLAAIPSVAILAHGCVASCSYVLRLVSSSTGPLPSRR